MVQVETVQETGSSAMREHARGLLRAYGQFLLDTGSCSTHIPRLEQEIATLPTAYTARGGELLLVLVDEEPAACIAYRSAVEDTSGNSCEIKRLFVLPAFRGHGLARRLVAETLGFAASRGFTRAILDTDAATMPAAMALYRSLGFRRYQSDQGNLSYLELDLPPVARGLSG